MCKLLEKDKATALAKATETAAAELAAAKAGWESEMNATMAQKLEQAEVAKRNAVRDMEEDAEVCSCAGANESVGCCLFVFFWWM